MPLSQRFLEYQRHRRQITNNAATRKYEKTKKGFLMRSYRNMLSRITGVQKQKFHLYKGLSILPRYAFYEWSITHPNFNRLFDEWTIQGYPRKLTPSPNRIDASRGYEIGNIEWITHSENSRKVRRVVH